MGILFLILYFVFPTVAMTFIARLVCVPFSEKISDQMSKHPCVHWIWGGLAFICRFLFFDALNPAAWPPDFMVRRGQRQKLVERVQLAGGWAAVQRDCDALVEKHKDTGFYWYRGTTNALPPTLATLQPWSVQFDSPASSRGFKDEPQVAVVRIKIFGMHAAGGHSTPYFGLEVVSGPGAGTYRPRPSQGGVSGNCYWTYTRVTNRIYEIY